METNFLHLRTTNIRRMFCSSIPQVSQPLVGKDPSLGHQANAGKLLSIVHLVAISMNMHPKLRPLWQRALILPALTFLFAYKALHLPRRILPRDLKAIVKNWHYSMFWTLIKSGLTQAYIDEPCTFDITGKHLPKAQVNPEFRMTEAEFDQFHRDGFIGPFDAFSQEEMAQLRKEMLAVEKEKSQTYGFVTPRDRHLESARLWECMNHPAIVNALPSCLGKICFVGERSFSIKAPVPLRSNSIKPALLWSRTISTRQSTRHVLMKCFSSPFGSQSMMRFQKMAACNSFAARMTGFTRSNSEEMKDSITPISHLISIVIPSES